MHGRPPDVEARITFLRTGEGGRENAVRSGYRPQFYYRGEDHDAVHEYPEAARVAPGETATVLLHFLHPELLANIDAGEEFEIREGVQTVARGVITRILNLKENAAST